MRPKDFNEAKFNGDSVERYLRSRLKEISSYGTYAPVELVAMWSVTELLRAYLPDSFYMYVTSTPELLHGGNFTEIVNGTSVLPDILLQNITNTAINFKLLFNSQVLEATHTENDKTFLKLKKSNVGVESEDFDKVAFTVPARQVSLIKFSPLLDYAKQYALDSFHYMTLNILCRKL